jgi:hypothetical protein
MPAFKECIHFGFLSTPPTKKANSLSLAPSAASRFEKSDRSETIRCQSTKTMAIIRTSGRGRWTRLILIMQLKRSNAATAPSWALSVPFLLFRHWRITCVRSTWPFTPRFQQTGAHEISVPISVHQRLHLLFLWIRWSECRSALATFADFNISPRMVPYSTNRCFYQQCRRGPPWANVLRLLVRLTHMMRRLIRAASARRRFAKDGPNFSMKIGARPVNVAPQLRLAGSRVLATRRTGVFAAIVSKTTAIQIYKNMNSNTVTSKRRILLGAPRSVVARNGRVNRAPPLERLPGW